MGFIKLLGIRFGTLVFGGFCVAYGAFGIFVAATNLRPSRMSCAEFLSAKPAYRWVQVDDCWADYVHGKNIEHRLQNTGGTWLAGYAPLYENESKQGPIRAYLKVDDPQKGVEGGYKDGVKAFRGLAEKRFLADDYYLLDSNGELKVDPEFIVVDPGEKPHVLAALGALVFGGLLWALFYSTFRDSEHWKKALG